MEKEEDFFFFFAAIYVLFDVLVSLWFLAKIPQVHTPHTKCCVDLVPQLTSVQGSLISWTLKSNTSKLTPIVVSFFICTLSRCSFLAVCNCWQEKCVRFNSNLTQAIDVLEHGYFDRDLDAGAWMEIFWRKKSKTCLASPNPVLAP